MTTRIQKDFTFMAAVHFNNKFMVNIYEMSAAMAIISMDSANQNTAIERVNYFLNNFIEDCIFINESCKDEIEKYCKAGLKICAIPADPYDQVVGLILLNKCNAIMEDRVVISDLMFGSKLSNLVRFELDLETAQTQFSGNKWWNNSSLCTENALDCEKKVKKDKIVKLFDHKLNEWSNLELTWHS